MEKENGRKLGVGNAMGLTAAAGEGEEIRVVFDGEGAKLQAVLKELEDGRRRVREEKLRKERETKIKEANSSAGTPVPSTSAGQTPQQSSWRSSNAHSAPRPPAPTLLPPHPAHLPPRPVTLPPPPPISSASASQMANGSSGILPGRVRRPPPSQTRSSTSASSMSNAFHTRHPLPPNPLTHVHSNVPMATPIRSYPLSSGRLSRLNPHSHPSPHYAPSRSPSPISRRPGQSNQSARQREHEAVNEALFKNGYDHARIDANAVGGGITEDDVRQFFEGWQGE